MKVLIGDPHGAGAKHHLLTFQAQQAAFGVGVTTFSLRTEQLKQIRDTIDTYLANLPKPHVHAELMALYAQDAAETDKPWERWEVGQPMDYPNCRFLALQDNPKWDVRCEYRRKEGV